MALVFFSIRRQQYLLPLLSKVLYLSGQLLLLWLLLESVCDILLPLWKWGT